jgi:hypothetical protein
MKKKKLILFIVFCTLLCLLIFREIGIVNINLYKSTLSNSSSSIKRQINHGQEKNFSHIVNLQHNGRQIDTSTHFFNNLEPIKIEAILEEVVYSGNYYLPLVKNFKMTYQCTYRTVESANGHKVEGKITGEMKGRIQGFCSRRKAKELAFFEAKKQIMSYFDKLE